jgi:SSS family solute:Na+ symporter
MAWIPVMRLVAGALYEYLQIVQAYLGPPITAVFFLEVFAKRINGKGAVAGLIVGFILGMAKMTAQILAGIESVGPHLPGFLVAFGEFNFLSFCLVLFAVSVIVVVIVSLLTPRPSEETPMPPRRRRPSGAGPAGTSRTR